MQNDPCTTSFLLCPRCGRKTRTQVREDTELISEAVYHHRHMRGREIYNQG